MQAQNHCLTESLTWSRDSTNSAGSSLLSPQQQTACRFCHSNLQEAFRSYQTIPGQLNPSWLWGSDDQFMLTRSSLICLSPPFPPCTTFLSMGTFLSAWSPPPTPSLSTNSSPSFDHPPLQYLTDFPKVWESRLWSSIGSITASGASLIWTFFSKCPSASSMSFLQVSKWANGWFLLLEAYTRGNPRKCFNSNILQRALVPTR